jgi:hypothetical protein
MIMKLTMYEKAMGYTMAWLEELIEKHPFSSALVTAMIIDRFLW